MTNLEAAKALVDMVCSLAQETTTRNMTYNEAVAIAVAALAGSPEIVVPPIDTDEQNETDKPM